MVSITSRIFLFIVPLTFLGGWSHSAEGAVSRREPQLHSIRMEGNASLDTASLLSRMPLKAGDALAPAELKFSVNMIESTYRDHGYYEVAVTTSTRTMSAGVVDLTFRVVEGALFHVGELRVEGNHLIASSIIQRHLDVHSGDIFSQTKIFDGSRQLYMTGYFDAIDFHYSTTTARTVDVTLRVRERATRYLKGGVGYGTQTKERLTIGFEDLNFLGHARKLDLTATHSGFLTTPSHYRTTIVQGGLTQPFLFNTRMEGQTFVSKEWDNREPYDSQTTAWRSSVGQRFGTSITASMRYRYQGTRLTRVSPQAQTSGFTNISAAGPTFTFDNTNDPFLPALGWRVIGTYEEGVRFFAGDVRFHKLEGRAGRFDTLRGWTLFEGIQAGGILPDSTSDRDVIPIYERYFLGGANTIRGYSERELGPRDSAGASLGGNAFAVGNLEVRHALYRKIFGVVFLDGGQLASTDPGAVWPHTRMRSVSDFRYSTGFGFRLHSPVGAVRLEFGYKLNPEGGAGFLDRTGIHFSIGEVF